MSEQSQNPYVGPRTFTREERGQFYGREREARELLALILSERLVLFYAQSGAGKSSLLNTRIVPQLTENEGFFVLPVGRVSGELPEGVDEVGNIFTFNLIGYLEQGQQPSQRFSHATLNEVLAGLTTTDGEHYYYAPDEPAADVMTGSEQPPHMLVIDQFEEILTTHLDRWPDREEFFVQLNQAMLDDPMLWVLLVMREDHVAALRPYMRLMTDNMRARYYMKRMEAQAALAAIERPAERAGRPFAEGVAKNLTNNLRQIKVQAQEEVQLGQFVEPVQLQVVCYQLWENLVAAGRTEITHEDLEELGNVDIALSQFYEKAIASALKTTNVSEIDLRTWFDQRLITEAGTRGTVYQGKTETAGMGNAVVKVLSGQFLLRAEIRSGGTWYELVHDRFVDPILQANQDWRLRQSPLVQAAEKWNRSGRPRDSLYRDDQLKIVLDTIDRDAQEPLVQEFLTASEEAQSQRDLSKTIKEAEEQRKRAEAEARIARLLRRLAMALVVVFVIAVVFAIAATVQRGVASENEALAKENANLAGTRESEAIANAKLAATAETEAKANAESAQRAESLAVTRQKQALESAALAAKNESISLVQGSIFGGDIDEALLLATENIGRYEDIEVAPEIIVAEALLQSAQSNNFLSVPPSVDLEAYLNRMQSVMQSALVLEPDLAIQQTIELSNFYNRICQKLGTSEAKVGSVMPACQHAVDLVSSLDDPVLNFEVCQYRTYEGLDDLSASIGSICDGVSELTLAARVGETYSGMIGEVSGSLWTFAARDGDNITISMNADEGAELDGVLVLYGPDGTKLTQDNDSGDQNNALINGFPLFETGNYTIIARPLEQDQKGAYELSLSNELRLDGHLPFDEAINSELAPGENEFWTFEGVAGQIVSISMSANESDLDSLLVLRGPFGNRLAQDDESGEGHDALIREFRLQDGGRYLVMAAASPGSSGAYTLEIIDETSTVSKGNISPGGPVSELLQEGDSHLWFFDGIAGVRVNIAMAAIDSKLDSYLVLLGPDGAMVAENDDGGGDLDALIADTVLPQSGTYSIVAAAYDDSTSGEYSLELTDDTEGFTTFQALIDVGDSVERTLLPGESHLWIFEGRQGQRVSIAMEAIDESLDTNLRLYGPTERLVAENDDGGAGTDSLIEQVELAESGIYSIFAEAANNRSFGDYRLVLDQQVVLVPEPSPTATSEFDPLDFRYEIAWRLSDVNPMEAIATVTIEVFGGDGQYQYYRDDRLVEGPVFEYPWRLCMDNPGTLQVTSGDGQSVIKGYGVTPPCPATPTPGPTPTP